MVIEKASPFHQTIWGRQVQKAFCMFLPDQKRSNIHTSGWLMQICTRVCKVRWVTMDLAWIRG